MGNVVYTTGPRQREINTPSCVEAVATREDVEPYLHDESKLQAQSIGSIARPRTVEELRTTIDFHIQQGHALSLSASRTGLTGAGVPSDNSHLISLERLKGITKLVLADDELSGTVSLLPGTSLADLQAYIAEHAPALFFPVDPTETSASIGGMVATNAGGARSYRYGQIRPWVRALQIEFLDGTTSVITRGGVHANGGEIEFVNDSTKRLLRATPIPKPRTKNSIGYCYDLEVDPIDLFIGSEGTLGIISEITLDLEPLPLHRLYFVQFFSSVKIAFDFVRDLKVLDADTLAIEFLDNRSLALAREGKAAETATLRTMAEGAAAAVFVDFAAPDITTLEALQESVLNLSSAVGADIEHSFAGTDDRTLREIKLFRHAVPEQNNATIAARRATFPELHKLATDMAVQDDDLEWVYDLYCSVLSAHNLEFAVFGHIGDNHFHVNILPRDPAELKLAKTLYLDIAREVVKRGGAVAAEHGIGRMKREFLKVQYNEEILNSMRSIKSFFDPQWLLNRGVLLAE